MLYTLITGATSGIGREFANVAAKNGKNLIIVGRDDTKLAQVKTEIEADYSKIDIITINEDLSKPEAAKNIFDIIQGKNLQIEHLINNAGFGDYCLFASSDLKKQIDMTQVNIELVTKLTHYFLPDMVKRKHGHILNLASVAAFLPGPMMSVYYATKAYVLSFSQALAEELSDSGVTVTALCPGPTDSNFSKIAGNERTDIIAKTRRLPTSREVAEFGYNAMLKGERVAIHGFGNILIVFFLRFLPITLVTKFVYRFQRAVH
jgi:short-subunit dehydrogenase